MPLSVEQKPLDQDYSSYLRLLFTLAKRAEAGFGTLFPAATVVLVIRATSTILDATLGLRSRLDCLAHGTLLAAGLSRGARLASVSASRKLAAT